jgi:hypothetical protein
MKKIFTEPANPEELYAFFTYGLPLDPLNRNLRWHPNSTLNRIKRRTWVVETTLHSDSIMVDYQPGVKADSAWYIYEWMFNKCT